ncbi:MAG: response regulator [Anaerolinea sp.]|nr:response regulator [Anaerolinea sp.]
MRALVVEDDVNTVLLLSFLLEQLTFEVLTAESVVSALGVLEGEQTIDLVVVDILLPGQPGSVLVNEMLLNYPQIPVLIVSAHVDMSGLELGFSRFVPCLTKPFLNQQFRETVRMLVKVP